MTDRPPHAVVLRAPASFDAKKVSAALAVRSTLPAESWLPVVRRAWGIVAEPSPAEEAEALASALTAAGLAALAVPVSLLEQPSPALIVTKADLAGDGFEFRLHDGPENSLGHGVNPWRRFPRGIIGAAIMSG